MLVERIPSWVKDSAAEGSLTPVIEVGEDVELVLFADTDGTTTRRRFSHGQYEREPDKCWVALFAERQGGIV